MILQLTEEATGEFDPIGTVVVLVIIAACVYGARRMWLRYNNSGAIRWVAVGAVLALIALVAIMAFLLNLAAALGLV